MPRPPATPVTRLVLLLAALAAVVLVPGAPRPAAAAPPEPGTRLLVGLAVPDRPMLGAEGAPRDPAADRADRAAIARAQDRLAAALPGTGVQVEHRYATVPGVLVTATPAGRAALAASPLVASIEEDRPERPALDESVPLVGADDAHRTGYDGSGWDVAVLDTGVDRTHPFFTAADGSSRVVAEACFSANGDCPDGTPEQTGTGAGVPCTFLPGSCQHGTHVAGIAAGRAGDLVGVAPGAGIIAVNVFTEVTGNLCGPSPADSPCALTLPSDQLKGLEFVESLAATRRIAAVNLSIGGLPFTSTCDANGPLRAQAITRLRAAGVATVAAAGNENATGIDQPACFSDAISVGATTKADTVAPYSNSATWMSLWAPGSSIWSSVPGGGYGTKSGTSMATPHVAGAFAVLRQQTPAATVSTVLDRLRTSGVPVTDPDNGVTAPRLALFAALAAGADPSGLRMTVAPAPQRVLDTRTGAGPLGPGETRSWRIAPPSIPADATAVVVNLTLTGATAPTYVTAWRSGDPRPVAVSAATAGVTAGNLVVVALDATGSFDLYNSAGSVDVVADVFGWLAPGGGALRPARPVRLADTRETTPVTAGGPRLVPVPADAVPADTTAVLVNLTTVGATDAGFLTAGVPGAAPAGVASVNPAPGHDLPNLALVPVTPGGAIELVNAAGSTHVTVDLVGTLGATGRTLLPTQPGRWRDSRPLGLGLGDIIVSGTLHATRLDGTPIDGNTVTGTWFGVTVFEADRPTMVAFHGVATPPPPTASVNAGPSDLTPNGAFVPGNGTFQYYVTGGIAQLTMDLFAVLT